MAVAEVEFSPWNSNPSLKKHALSAVEGRGKGRFSRIQEFQKPLGTRFHGYDGGSHVDLFCKFPSATLKRH